MDLQNALDKAVIALFGPKSYCSAFLTNLYCSLKFEWRTDIPTACTNGLFLWINPDWFMTLSENFRPTLLAHELWHIAYLHPLRGKDLNHKIFNMAADHAINLMLIQHGYTFDRDPQGKMIGLADPRFRGMPAEAIYKILLDENPPIDLPFGSDFTNASDVGDKKDDGGGSGANGQDPSPPPLTQQQQNQVISNLARAALAQQMAGKQAGDLPGDFAEMMDKLLRPRIKWTTHLDRWMTERVDDGFTWQRPNRRFPDVYLPSKSPQENGLSHLLYFIDCSCSLTKPQLRTINSELKGLKDKFQPVSMKIASFDTIIHDVFEFSAEQDLESLLIHGRGGTDMRECFALAAKEKPKAMIMFSDMECSYPPQVKGVEVLWVCLDNPKWKPPYGKAIHIDTAQDL